MASKPLDLLAKRHGLKNFHIGQWNDPNPSTQNQPEDIGITTTNIELYHNSTDLGPNPAFNHVLGKAYKDAENFRYNQVREEEDSTPEEQREFASVPYNIPFDGIGEDPLFTAKGQNIIQNDNEEELNLRFSGPLYSTATDDRFEPATTNYHTFASLGQPSTYKDKAPVLPGKTNLDGSFVIQSVHGYSHLRNDFVRQCPQAPGLDTNEKPSISMFNDVPSRNDEFLTKYAPIDQLPVLGNRISTASTIMRSYKH